MIAITKNNVEVCLNKMKELVNSLLHGMTPTQIQDSYDCKELLRSAQDFVRNAKYKAERIINKDEEYYDSMVSVGQKPDRGKRIFIELKKSINFQEEKIMEENRETLMKSFDDEIESLEKAGAVYGGEYAGSSDKNDLEKKKTKKKVLKNEAISDKGGEKEEKDEKEEAKKAHDYPKADVVDETTTAEDKKRKRKKMEGVSKEEKGTDMPKKEGKTDSLTEPVGAFTNYDNPPLKNKNGKNNPNNDYGMKKSFDEIEVERQLRRNEISRGVQEELGIYN